MTFLQEQGFRCPKPILSKGGESLNFLMDKPALIVSFLDGEEVKNINKEDCYKIGNRLGRLHNLGMKFKEKRENSRDLLWIKNKYQELNNEPFSYIKTRKEISFLISSHQTDLPTGIIHGDLFRDNVLFEKIFWIY